MALGNPTRYVTSDAGIGSRKTTPTTSSTTTTTTRRKKVSTPAASPTTATATPTVYYYGGGGGGSTDEEAYDDRYDRIAAAYERASELLKNNYDSQVGRLNAAKKKSVNETQSDAEKSLREAYVNNMMNRRDLNQRLSALGYNGGMTETTMAKLANQYGNARTDINNTRARNLSNIKQTYGDNLAAALQAYNNAMADLEMKRLSMELSLG